MNSWQTWTKAELETPLTWTKTLRNSRYFAPSFAFRYGFAHVFLFISRKFRSCSGRKSVHNRYGPRNRRETARLIAEHVTRRPHKSPILYSTYVFIPAHFRRKLHRFRIGIRLYTMTIDVELISAVSWILLSRSILTSHISNVPTTKTRSSRGNRNLNANHHFSVCKTKNNHISRGKIRFAGERRRSGNTSLHLRPKPCRIVE